MASYNFILLLLSISHAWLTFATAAKAGDAVSTDSPAQELSQNTARLLVSKRILNLYVVQDLDMAIQYEIYNVGDASAYGVKLEDQNFPSEYFDSVAGTTSAQWNRIAPLANVTHSVILRPNQPMQFNFTAAQVEYASRDGAKEKTFVLSSVPLVSSYDGSVYTWDKTMFVRRFNPHYIDWLVFAIMTIPSLAIPYFMFSKSRDKYDGAAQYNTVRVRRE